MILKYINSLLSPPNLTVTPTRHTHIYTYTHVTVDAHRSKDMRLLCNQPHRTLFGFYMFITHKTCLQKELTVTKFRRNGRAQISCRFVTTTIKKCSHVYGWKYGEPSCEGRFHGVHNSIEVERTTDRVGLKSRIRRLSSSKRDEDDFESVVYI